MLPVVSWVPCNLPCTHTASSSVLGSGLRYPVILGPFSLVISESELPLRHLLRPAVCSLSCLIHSLFLEAAVCQTSTKCKKKEKTIRGGIAERESSPGTRRCHKTIKVLKQTRSDALVAVSRLASSLLFPSIRLQWDTSCLRLHIQIYKPAGGLSSGSLDHIPHPILTNPFTSRRSAPHPTPAPPLQLFFKGIFHHFYSHVYLFSRCSVVREVIS